MSNEVPLQAYIYSYLKNKLQDEESIHFDHDGNLEIRIAGLPFNFFGSTSPFNSRTVANFINDKWALYDSAKLRINVPYTESFVKKECDDEKLTDTVLEKVESKTHPFSFPLIIKPNNGSLSSNVYIAHNREELYNAINANRIDNDNGELILIQQYIGPAEEYRAICFNGSCVFAYEKNIDEANESTSLNPIYWNGSKARIVDNQALLDQFSVISEYLFKEHRVTYVGMDLRIDDNKQVWLLEGNNAPMGLRRVVLDTENGKDMIDSLCDRMIADMRQTAITAQKSQYLRLTP